MLKITLSAVAASLLLAISLIASPSQAQPARVFVAAQGGSDSNPCTFAAPCRTFQKGHDTVAAGGEIDVLDPAGYGALTITKAISIQGHGFSGVSVASGNSAITINAGANDKINLRGLIIEGAGVGANGIVFNTGASLTVENSVIRNLTNRGIQFFPNAASTLTVSDTLIADNGGRGIIVAPTGLGLVTAVFNRVEVSSNTVAGITLKALPDPSSTIKATATDSVFAKNGGHGLGALTGTVIFLIIRSVVAYNGVGVETTEGDSEYIYLAQSAYLRTQPACPGIAQSFGDNYVLGNTSDGSGLGTVAKQ